MTRTRKIWYLILSLAVIAGLIFACTLGVIRTGGMFRVVLILADLTLLYLAYEAIVGFYPNSNKENQSTENKQSIKKNESN